MSVATSIRALALLAAIAARAEAQNVAPRSPQELGPALGGVAAPPSIATAFDTTVAASCGARPCASTAIRSSR